MSIVTAECQELKIVSYSNKINYIRTDEACTGFPPDPSHIYLFKNSIFSAKIGDMYLK